MGTKILNIGTYFKTDSNGILLSHIAQNKIQEKWRFPVDDFVLLIKGIYLENTHSIYLRGSVATNTAIEWVSDIDFFIITKRPITPEEKNYLWGEANNLNKRYSFITRFDVGFYTSEEIVYKKERALIKLMAICLYGENIIEKIPTLRPGKDIAVTLPSLEEEIKDTLQKINSGFFREESIRAICVWLMKRLLRAGFELTAERSNCFTRDLYKCWEMFAQYYPEKNEDMYRVLDLAINPTTDPKKIISATDPFSPWMVQEAKSLSII